ncbi:MAG: 23S rRNA (pseudouridine(1915)-N(3))-methyltransferase RlmH [Oscillospiraceae bacterium]|nr:23S rRNA (pseudouridine(1915)-N(3))-methyltransferase RlmH [Oscillospiraceae bacterium]
MNSIEVIAVGTLHKGFLEDGCAEYMKRMKNLFRFQMTELSEQKLVSDDEQGIKKVIDLEGEKILKALDKKQDAFIAAMCIEGKTMKSEDLALLMKDLEPQGRRLIFIIGGSYGLSDEVKKLADLKLSMSPMTFPHQMARLMLLEQIYRAGTINAGIKYHK